MSIIQFNNRNSYKNKAALELVFKKSMDYKLPPGYHSLDICLIGGGAGGLGFGGIATGSSTEGHGDSWTIWGSHPGGQGGYVTNYKNIEVPNNYYFKVNIGKGGKGEGYIQIPYGESIKVCSGGDTYIKNLITNEKEYRAKGGQGFHIIGKYVNVLGGANLGDFAYIVKSGTELSIPENNTYEEKQLKLSFKNRLVQSFQCNSGLYGDPIIKF